MMRYNNDWLDYLAHSKKGSSWKNHKYLRKENGRYIYFEDDRSLTKSSTTKQSKISSRGNLFTKKALQSLTKKVVKSTSETIKKGKKYVEDTIAHVKKSWKDAKEIARKSKAETGRNEYIKAYQEYQNSIKNTHDQRRKASEKEKFEKKVSKIEKKYQVDFTPEKPRGEGVVTKTEETNSGTVYTNNVSGRRYVSRKKHYTETDKPVSIKRRRESTGGDYKLEFVPGEADAYESITSQIKEQYKNLNGKKPSKDEIVRILNHEFDWSRYDGVTFADPKMQQLVDEYNKH